MISLWEGEIPFYLWGSGYFALFVQERRCTWSLAPVFSFIRRCFCFLCTKERTALVWNGRRWPALPPPGFNWTNEFGTKQFWTGSLPGSPLQRRPTTWHLKQIKSEQAVCRQAPSRDDLPHGWFGTRVFKSRNMAQTIWNKIVWNKLFGTRLFGTGRLLIRARIRK